MLEINPFTIGYSIAETRKLLDEHGLAFSPTTLRFTTTNALRNYLKTGTITTDRPRLSETLADPLLTGMSRQDLHQMIERLTPHQAAQTERRRYHQRGGDRLPGTRGAVFQQKITDAERILAAILYLRKICTRQVLADLFHVSPRTIGNALTQVRPLLNDDGYVPNPAASRFSTATALLTAVTPQNTADTAEPPC